MRHFTILILAFVGVTQARARGGSTTAPAATQPDAAVLVREIRAQEAWVDDVNSLQLRVESHWIHPAEAVKRRRAELMKQFPDTQPTTRDFPGLAPESHDQLVIAFDRHRAYDRWDGDLGPGTFEMRFWDGRRAVSYWKYRSDQPAEYALDSTPKPLQNLLLNLVWPRTAPHHFWFVPDEQQTDEEFLGKPEDFHFAGYERVGTVECCKLESPMYWWTLYIGTKDHRVYRMTDRALPRNRSNPRDNATIYVALAATQGKHVSSAGEYYAWYKTLPKPKQEMLEREEFKRLEPFSVPYTDDWYGDYHEVAPGDWMPMTMGYSIIEVEANPMYVSARRTIRIVDVKVNQPLPEKYFQIEFQEGLKVNDWSHNPPLFYTYKKNRSPEEWKQIEDQANRQAQDEKQSNAEQDKLIGHPASAFPKSATWLNSKPLEWSHLKGKVVLLDFFAEWCGPCRNDYPTLVDLSKQKDSGIVVIGVHPPGSEQAAIKKLMKQYGMTYPVCIDIAPPKGSKSWGEMYSTYGIWGIPHSFVIDRNGNVAAHGDLRQTLAKAHELAAK